MTDLNILAFTGSSREGSYNEQLLEEATKIAEGLGAKVTTIRLADFEAPIYDTAFEQKNGMPATLRKLRRLMIESQGIMIASPEHNASVTARLKNVIDWLSRGEEGGYSPVCFEDKAFAIMSASPGQNGGQRGLIHLSDMIQTLGGQIIPLQTSVGNAHEYFVNKDCSNYERLKQEVEALISEIATQKMPN